MIPCKSHLTRNKALQKRWGVSDVIAKGASVLSARLVSADVTCQSGPT
jgi:hypothetical protein